MTLEESFISQTLTPILNNCKLYGRKHILDVVLKPEARECEMRMAIWNAASLLRTGLGRPQPDLKQIIACSCYRLTFTTFIHANSRPWRSVSKQPLPSATILPHALLQPMSHKYTHTHTIDAIAQYNKKLLHSTWLELLILLKLKNTAFAFPANLMLYCCLWFIKLLNNLIFHCWYVSVKWQEKYKNSELWQILKIFKTFLN